MPGAPDPAGARPDGAGLAGGRASFAGRAAIVVGIAALVVALLLVLWAARTIVLLAFGGVLLALLLRGLSDPIARRTRMPGGVALALVLIALVGLLALGVTLRAPAVAAQVDTLREVLPRTVDELATQLEQYGWGRAIVAELRPMLQRIEDPGTMMLDRAGWLVPSILHVVALGFVLVFTALYVAAEPRWYAQGLVRLVAPHRRDRAREVLGELGDTLRRWLLARLTSMAIVGVLTGVGLWLLDMPLVLTLALIAALLDFIPSFGPVLAAIPAVLLAAATDPTRALYVAALYLGVQMLEAYAITPVLQRHAVSLPPALVLSLQATLGILVGALGLALAAPVTVVVIVLVRTLYVEGMLERGHAAARPADDADVAGGPLQPDGAGS